MEWPAHLPIVGGGGVTCFLALLCFSLKVSKNFDKRESLGFDRLL